MSDWVLTPPTSRWATRTTSTLTGLGLLAAITFVLGLFVAPERVWRGYLVGFNLLTGLALAGPIWLAFSAISGARWTRPLEGVLRAMGAALPFAGGCGLLLLVGVPSLYEWSHAAHVADDAILQQKAAYLNVPFFAVRMVAYFVIWTLTARYLARATRSTEGSAAEVRRRRMRAGAIFLLLFTPTFTLACTDWLLSLDPHWFSAIYAMVVVVGVALAGLAAAVLLGVGAERGKRVGEERLADIGALLLSLALMWGYLWYCQYMLVWYTNLPEETFWYEARLAGGWGLLTKASLAMGCVLPFVVLLFRGARRSRRILVELSAAIMLAHIVDIYVLVGPSSMGETPVLGLWEIAAIVAPLCLFFVVAVRTMRRDAPAPV